VKLIIKSGKSSAVFSLKIFNSQTQRLQSQADNLQQIERPKPFASHDTKAKMDACGLT
jgi:hypothetical protein